MQDEETYEYSPVGLKNSQSGYRGVCWNKKAKRWRATIGVRGQTLHLGSFPKLLDALDAREKAEIFYEALRQRVFLNRPSATFKER